MKKERQCYRCGTLESERDGECFPGYGAHFKRHMWGDKQEMDIDRVQIMSAQELLQRWEIYRTEVFQCSDIKREEHQFAMEVEREILGRMMRGERISALPNNSILMSSND